MASQFLVAIVICCVLVTCSRGEDKLYNDNNRMNIGRQLRQQYELIRLATPECNPAVDNCGGINPECEDIPLPGTTCDAVVAKGSCDADLIKGIYCAKSCETCLSAPSAPSAPLTQQKCEDIPLPGTTCDGVVAKGLCDADLIKGIYCAKSCATCLSAPSAPSAPLTQQIAGDDCEALDAIQCDIEGLQALSPEFDGITDPCSGEVTGITCTNNRVTNISVGQVKNYLSYVDGYYEVDVDATYYSFDLWGRNIPAEFSKLRYLQRLEVEGTDIRGTIPPEISTLSRMLVLDIDEDKITGTLPPELSTWNKIKWFDASQCQFTGTIPASYSTWTDVVLIDLSEGPKLTGSLPEEWSTLNKLQDLYLYEGGQYTGSVPTQWSTLEDNILKLIFGTQDSLCIDSKQGISLTVALRDKEDINTPQPPFTDAKDLQLC